MEPAPIDAAPNEAVALAIDLDVGAVIVGEHGARQWWAPGRALAEIERIERDIGPRWIWWTADTPRLLAAAGIRPARCWDLDAVHRLLDGGWRCGPSRSWATAHGLDTNNLPTVAPVDLFSTVDTEGPGGDGPVRDDGHLDPAWVEGGWRRDVDRLESWADLALEVYRRQAARLGDLADRPLRRRRHGRSLLPPC